MLKTLKKALTPSKGTDKQAILPRHQGQQSNTDFWTNHNVTNHQQFSAKDDSLAYFHWRNAQYLFYDQLMPVSGYQDKVVLDYGCGPGNDLVGFWEYSKPKRLIGMDISPVALAEAKARLALQGAAEHVELQVMEDATAHLPFETHSIDYLHSSGVLHHVPNLPDLMAEFYRVLKPEGTFQLMIYNYDSLWVHLYVAYLRQRVKKIDADLPLLEAFRRSTDGEGCPISRCYQPQAFMALAQEAGFEATHVGNAISVFEMSLLPERLKAIQSLDLPREHRDFLTQLTFDAYGRPLADGQVAGIDAVYALRKRG